MEDSCIEHLRWRRDERQATKNAVLERMKNYWIYILLCLLLKMKTENMVSRQAQHKTVFSLGYGENEK